MPGLRSPRLGRCPIEVGQYLRDLTSERLDHDPTLVGLRFGHHRRPRPRRSGVAQLEAPAAHVVFQGFGGMGQFVRSQDAREPDLESGMVCF